MKISELLSTQKTTLSFELFPPKKEADLDSVLTASNTLAALRPDFMSVTYGAGGGTSKRTLEIASHMQKTSDITALAHLTCVTASPGHIRKVLQDMEKEQIQNVLALRGDPPKDGTPAYTDYRHANELISEIRGYGDFCVGGACYPDGHPECESRAKDIENIRFKVEAGCDFLISQLFFNNDVLYNFLYRLAAQRIDVPVIAGIMPITNASLIHKMTTMCGAVLTPKHKAVLERFADNPQALLQSGIAFATDQIVDLVANGVRGIHLYTMNRPEIAQQIYNNVSYLFASQREL